MRTFTSGGPRKNEAEAVYRLLTEAGLQFNDKRAVAANIVRLAHEIGRPPMDFAKETISLIQSKPDAPDGMSVELNFNRARGSYYWGFFKETRQVRQARCCAARQKSGVQCG